MPSDRQINANRNNARRSTGPQSDSGKAASARNALTHGLAAKHHILPIENAQEFYELLDACREQFQPQNDFQDSIVRQIAIDRWRLERFNRVEAGYLYHRLEDLCERPHNLDPLDEYKPQTHEEENDLEATRRLGKIFRSASEQAFLTLSRYQTSINRSMHKNIEQLRRLQAQQPPPTPPEKYETNPIPKSDTTSPSPTPDVGSSSQPAAAVPGGVADRSSACTAAKDGPSGYQDVIVRNLFSSPSSSDIFEMRFLACAS
jgi:hypothetical protein